MRLVVLFTAISSMPITSLTHEGNTIFIWINYLSSGIPSNVSLGILYTLIEVCIKDILY